MNNVTTRSLRVIRNLTKNKLLWRMIHSERFNITKNGYNIKRGNYGHVEDKHLHFFRTLLGENRVITNSTELDKYNIDWFLNFKGNSSTVLKPRSTEEVATLLKFCNDNRLAVCPQGGNTGVVGGSIPVFDEIIISTELMNKNISLDEISGVLVCQSGCILEQLNNYLQLHGGLVVPLDLGSKGSCTIGGNVSTNAGGTRLLRYGNLHGNVLGLEVVKANGEVIDCLSTLKKDNTGFHLKHLFIGSEGTLGFITKVSINCPPKPAFINVAFLGCQNYTKVIKTFKKAKEDLSEVLSAIEVMDAATMEIINEKLSITSPIGEYPFYLLIETSGINENHDSEKVFAFLESCLSKHYVLNGTIASEPQKVKSLWDIRERIPETFKQPTYTYDFTLPIYDYFTLVDDVRHRVGELAEKVFGFGHLGDGNLHLQIAVQKYQKEISDLLEPFVYNRTIELGGSISAEHGIGVLKRKYMPLAKPQNNLNLAKQLKKLMDPNGTLNPYKVLS